MNILKSGAVTLILATLISGCASTPPTSVPIPPRIFPSELSLQGYPIKPAPEDRTNCNMHNYRLQVEEWGCDVAITLDDLVQRLNGARISVPVQCIDITVKDRKYCHLDKSD